ncbi:MAG: 1-acyl-sn-glycerol-3-phosphate acyltransferase [Desulfobacterales bacterium]
MNIRWDVQGLEGFSTDDSYLVISNHRSWTDIFVLQHIFNHRIPFLKFFLKKERCGAGSASPGGP